MTILLPTTARILDRALDLIDTATRHNDQAALAVLTRVKDNIDRGATLRWDMYELLVTSVNTPGKVYTVDCGVCDCIARKPCWHIAAYEIAIELLDDQDGDSDFEADADDPEPLPTPRFTLSAYAVQRFIVEPLVARTRQTLDTMRAQQHGRRLAQARGGSQWAA